MIHWVHAETGNILDLIRKVAKEKGRKEQQSTWALLERRAEVEYRAAGSRVACLSTRTSTRTLQRRPSLCVCNSVAAQAVMKAMFVAMTFGLG